MEGLQWNTAASATLLVIVVLCSTPCFIDAARIQVQRKDSSDFIASSCRVTTFQRLCVDSLSPYASTIRDSPLELARAALSVSLSGARSASAVVSKLAADGGLLPREVAAVRDCMTTTGDSVDELQRSLEAMGSSKRDRKGKEDGIGMRMNDIQTWVSAALTDNDTCMDGFSGGGRGIGGAVKAAIRRQIVNVAQLTSNALALINSLNSS